MVSFLNPQSRDLKHGGAFSNNCEVINLSMKSQVRLKDQVKSLVGRLFPFIHRRPHTTVTCCGG